MAQLKIQIIGPRGEHSCIQRLSSDQFQEGTKSCDVPAVAMGNSSDTVGSWLRIEVSQLAHAMAAKAGINIHAESPDDLQSPDAPQYGATLTIDYSIIRSIYSSPPFDCWEGLSPFDVMAKFPQFKPQARTTSRLITLLKDIFRKTSLQTP